MPAQIGQIASHPASNTRGMAYYQSDPLQGGAFLPRMEGGIAASQDQHLVDSSLAHELAPNFYSGAWQSHLQNDEQTDEEDD